MLIGSRVRLRPIERDDIPRFVAWLGDPQVREHLDLILGLGTDNETRWYESTLALPILEQPFSVDFRDAQTELWRHVGSAGFHQVDWRCRSCEIGLAIGDRTVWDRGIGTEVTEMLLRHGFETMNLHRVWLRVYVDNLRAIRVYEKLGFVKEGRFRDGDFRRGQYRDVLLYSVLRGEWQARGESPTNGAS